MRRSRASALAIVVALALTGTALLAGTAQAKRATTQRVVIKVTCSTVKYLYLGFPELPNNQVHEKIKINGKVVSKPPISFVFNGNIAENEVPIKIPAAGKYLIQAGVTWNTNAIVGESTTKKVEEECPGGGAISSYTIEKFQKIAGEPAYTSTELTGKAGQTVDYKVVVKNTGETNLTFSNFSDANCENIKGGPGATEIKPLEEATYTCEHTLSNLGLYENTASVEGSEGTGKHTSNTVKVNVPSGPAFTIVKEQKIAGEPAFTQKELNSEIGKTVDYKIIVKNTGNVPLAFSEFTDPNCENIAGGPGAKELGPGESSTYTCEHTLAATGPYSNEAVVTGTPPIVDGFPLTHTSNKVTVNVPVKATFTIAKEQRIAGEPNYTKSELSGKVGQTVEYKVLVKNTGNVTLKFESLKDANCELITGGPSELAPGKEATYNCTHTLSGVGSYINEASIEANEGAGTKTSNKVIVKVVEEAKFTIEKQQRLAGEGSYATTEKAGKTGQTVEYKIIVKNTGNTTLKFSALTDASCENVSPLGTTELAAGAEESFTCTRVLGGPGSYGNEASIEGNGGTGTKTSNKVTVKVAEEGTYAIEKQQRIAGEPGYTTSEVTGELGQAVEYKVLVKNTSNTTLKFGALKDTGCEGISPAGATELAAGGEESFTCTHTLSSVGSYSNEASIEGNEGTGKKTSNKVIAKVPAEPAFTIEKLQRLAGEPTYGTAELSGKLGQKVEYEIIVKDTGNTKLTFANFTDTNCETVKGGPTKALAPGESATYTCEHTLSSVGSYNNQASVEGDPGAGEGLPVTHSSNPVTTTVPAEPSFTIEKQQRIKGEGTYSVAEKTAKSGETAEYKIVVKNTGNLALKFGALKDANCTGISPGGATELAPGKEESFTCSHLLTVGTDTNEASIEGNEGTGTKKSAEVTVKVPAEPSFTIEKQQRIKGEANYTAAARTGEVGQTDEYEIIVKNTGNVPLKFGALNDANCEGVSPAGASELAAGAKETFTCTHVLAVGTYVNEASIEGNEGTGTETSNKVTVTVASKPSFAIEKFQKIEGEPTYSTSPVTGSLGQKVEYKIVVTNTGNVTLKFTALSDPNCEGVSPTGTVELGVGKAQTYTCTHTLSVGSYTNEASIEGNEGTGKKTSNKVIATVVAEPSFTIEKQQRIKGEANYGTAEKTGELGQTAEYKVIVKNTGNVTLKFGALKDSGCEGISPSGSTEVPVAGEESFTCSHVLTVGTDTNEASIEGNEGTGKQTSNKVTVKVPAKPAFTIEKQQRIEGEASYTVAEVSGSIGQKVEYKVVVKNTGNVTLKFGALKDANCEAISPAGTTELAPGKEESFTCTHTLASVGSYSNEASIEGNEGTGKQTSNLVTAKVPVEASFTIEKQQRFSGEANYVKTELTGGDGDGNSDDTVEYKVIVKNTGNVPIKFGALKDANCEGVSPSGITELAPGKEESFTCTHLLKTVGPYSNEASIEGNEGTGTKTSNKVTVKVLGKPNFTITKEQRLEGEASYAAGDKNGEIGETVEYKIKVKNTGNVTLKFGALKDAGCEGISPSGTTELAPNAEESFTCSHVLTSIGETINEASIEGNEGAGTKTSNKVKVKVVTKASYTIEKQQRLEGEGSYTTAEKTGEAGQKVEYKVTVKNTGNVTLKFGALKDTNCEAITPSGATELAPGKEESFTCTHTLTVGNYQNVASIEGNEGSGTHNSNTVKVNVPVKAAFTIEKLEKIAGEPTYTSSELPGKVGQTVDYEIVVKNTGNVTIKFGNLSDSGCTGISPSGATELAAGKEETFTCTHLLASAGTYTNEASIPGNEGTGTKTSNKVTVKVAAEPAFTIEKQQRVEGESAYSTAELFGKLGQKAEYKVIVKNTGNVAIKFGALKDGGCEKVTPSGATELGVGAEESFTCQHTLAGTGPYTNEASIEGEGAGTKTSNKVTVSVKAAASFVVEKLQRIGAESFSAGKKDGAVGQTIEYQINAKNTGNVALTFSGFTDAKCEAGTLAGGPIGPVGPGETTTWTCKHVITTADETAGSYTNEASVTGSEGTGTKSSNKTEVEVPAKCPKEKGPKQINARWHYSAAGSSGSWSATGEIVCGKEINFGPQAMEGNQKLKPGTEIKAGWDFTIPGNNSAKPWTATFLEGRIIFRKVACEKGEKPSTELLEIKLPEEVYVVPPMNTEWFPSGDQKSELVYQGKATIPAVCGPKGENNVELGHGGSAGGGSWEGFMTLK